MARLSFLLLLLWVGVAVSSAVDLQKRIIGGRQCERRFHVKLRGVAANGMSNLCGGSLISKRWILTAAHCLKPGRTLFAYLYGATKGVEITAQPVIYKDKHNNRARQHDLMLLQLPEDSNIQPVDLPDCGDQPRISESVEIAGHAAISGGPNNERISSEVPTLHCADIQVVDCKDLVTTLKRDFPDVYQVKQYQDWFCGQSSTVDICFGDSGGGVVHKNKIYGVISFLGDPDFVCRKAAAFMDLCNPEYAAWIKTTIT